MNRILILSADLSLLDRLAPAMRRADLDVACAAGIAQGLEQLDETDVSVVVLDELVTVDSWKLCRCIDRIFSVGVILLGSKPSEEAWAGAEEVGFDFYLEKPVNFSELGARARALLRRKKKWEGYPG